MIQLRKADSRGHANHGWLDSHFTFSFADYHDPAHMGFRSLRVMNEDRIEPGMGFGTHGHRDMEIVTYVLDGALEHKDSMGNGEVLRSGEFQRISAGSGITHSEFNPSNEHPVHLYQIWLLPQSKGIDPSYQQTRFDESELKNRFRLVASPPGSDGSLRIHQDARVYLSRLDAGEQISHAVERNRHLWLQVLRGDVMLGENHLATSDGAAVSDESRIVVTAHEDAELMLFDLN